MQIIRSTTILALLAMAMFIAPALAQSDGGRKVQFTCASWEQVEDELYYSDGKKKPAYYPVSLSVMSRSPLYETRSKGVIPLYRIAGTNDKGEPIYKKVAQVRTISGCDRLLLLFFPKEDGKYSIRVIRDERKDSPFGGYQFFNFSELQVAGALDKKRFMLKPGSRKTIEIKNKNKGTQMPYATFTEIEGKRMWLQRNTFHFNPNKHAKFFIVQVPTTNGRPKVKAKAIVEFYQPDPTEGSQSAQASAPAQPNEG